MTKSSVYMGMGLAGIVLLVLFLFTRDGMQPDRKQRNELKNGASVTQAKPTQERKMAVVKQERKVSNKAKRRERILRRWAKMTPEQRKEFMKKHPNFKPPVETPAATGIKPVGSTPHPQPVTTEKATKPQPAKASTQ